jgi:hypothetical protein
MGGVKGGRDFSHLNLCAFGTQKKFTVKITTLVMLLGIGKFDDYVI